MGDVCHVWPWRAAVPDRMGLTLAFDFFLVDGAVEQVELLVYPSFL